MRLLPENLTFRLGFDQILEATRRYLLTSGGKKTLESLRPSSARKQVENALEQCGEMMRLISRDDPLPLNETADILPSLDKAAAQGAVLEIRSLLDILNTAGTARRLKTYFRTRDEQYPRLYAISCGLIPLKELENQINHVLTEQGEVKDDASPRLQSIRKQLAARKQDLRETLARIIRKAAKDGMMAENEATIRGGRMVIPVKAEYKRKISGFVHDISATGQTVYMEPVEVLNINNEIRELESDEYHEIEALLRELTAQVREQRRPMQLNDAVIAELDVLQAKARLCLYLKAEIPHISDEQEVYLEDARNPNLLLKYLRNNQNEAVVPLRLEMPENEKGLIITGPNAGGKSVALKTAGLCQLMMQSGYAIPAGDRSRLPVFPALYVDMGDDQSIENDLSTFSSRLNWMKKMLDDNPVNSLVLIDEAGSGTDPEEGTVLYRTLMEMLTDLNARILVSTHHGALKLFAHEHPAWVNGSMEFDQKNLSPTYRFVKGTPGSSYAFEIAGRLGVQPELIERSRRLIGTSKNRMESLIVDLEAQSQEVRKLLTELEKEKKLTGNLRREYEEKLAKANRKRDEVRLQALQEARQILSTANSRIESALQAASSAKTSKAEMKKVRKELEDYREEVDARLDSAGSRKKPPDAAKEAPATGDTVRMLDAHTEGELIERKGSQATVLMNGLRIKTRYENLVKITGGIRSKKGKTKTSATGISKPANQLTPVKRSYPAYRTASSDSGLIHKASPVLHIRGYRADEAMSKLIHFVDNAIADGLSRVEIIHGKGEGILKNMVHEHLRSRHEVKGFEFAHPAEGGDGCTIVYFD